MTTSDDPALAYERMFPEYVAYTAKVRQLVEDIVSSDNIDFHVIEGRAKSIAGFREKISRPGKKYINALEELPDLCGCRVIAYYLEDVDTICNLIKSEFDVIEEELSHQPSSLQADRFGYLSAHYVVKINKSRAKLTEWQSFKDFRAEIQIRTVIQHAWSAVSHALQYKTETEVPSSLRRRLYRIAGLFELADEEFGSIRKQRIALRQSASASIAAGEVDIPLTSASLREFLTSWDKIPSLVAAGENAGFIIEPAYDEETSIGNIYDLATRSGIQNLGQLQSALEQQDFSKLAEIYGGQRPVRDWAASPDFLLYLLLLANRADLVTADYLEDRGWSRSIAEDVSESLRKFVT